MLVFYRFVLILVWMVISFEESTNSQVISRIDDLEGLVDGCSQASGGISLDHRLSSADVVLTGTILKLKAEDTRREIEHRSFETSPPIQHRPSRRTLTGHVKVWSVMKGSIEDISDKQRKYKKRKRDADILKRKNNTNARLSVADMSLTSHESPVVELYGLWNSHLCDSFLKEGDTRVFFLRKMEDHRSGRTRRSSSLKSWKKDRKSRRKKRERRRRNKNSSRKRKNLKSHKQNKQSKSIGAKWQKLMKKTKVGRRNNEKRQKNNQLHPSKPKQFSVLLVNAEPARITLKNLKAVESLSYKK